MNITEKASKFSRRHRHLWIPRGGRRNCLLTIYSTFLCPLTERWSHSVLPLLSFWEVWHNRKSPDLGDKGSGGESQLCHSLAVQLQANHWTALGPPLSQLWNEEAALCGLGSLMALQLLSFYPLSLSLLYLSIMQHAGWGLVWLSAEWDWSPSPIRSRIPQHVAQRLGEVPCT